MIEAETCPACGGRHHMTLYRKTIREDARADGYRRYIFRDVLRCRSVTTRMRLCLGCSLLFLTPRFSEDELARLYDPAYFARRAEYEPGWKPADHDHADQVRDSERQRRALISRIVAPFSAGIGSILDMGGGKGSLIPDLPSLTRAMVCDPGVRETEPHVQRVASAKEAGPVDMVMSTHVLEHLNDPRSFLTQLAGMVRPGGLIYLEVPYEGPPALFRRQGIGEHLNFFTLTALRRMAAECGLQVLTLQNHRYRYALWQTRAICAVLRAGPARRVSFATAFPGELAARVLERLRPRSA